MAASFPGTALATRKRVQAGHLPHHAVLTMPRMLLRNVDGQLVVAERIAELWMRCAANVGRCRHIGLGRHPGEDLRHAQSLKSFEVEDLMNLERAGACARPLYILKREYRKAYDCRSTVAGIAAWAAAVRVGQTYSIYTQRSQRSSQTALGQRSQPTFEIPPRSHVVSLQAPEPTPARPKDPTAQRSARPSDAAKDVHTPITNGRCTGLFPQRKGPRTFAPPRQRTFHCGEP